MWDLRGFSCCWKVNTTLYSRHVTYVAYKPVNESFVVGKWTNLPNDIVFFSGCVYVCFLSEQCLPLTHLIFWTLAFFKLPNLFSNCFCLFLLIWEIWLKQLNYKWNLKHWLLKLCDIEDKSEWHKRYVSENLYFMINWSLLELCTKECCWCWQKCYVLPTSNTIIINMKKCTHIAIQLDPVYHNNSLYDFFFYFLFNSFLFLLFGFIFFLFM